MRPRISLTIWSLLAWAWSFGDPPKAQADTTTLEEKIQAHNEAAKRADPAYNLGEYLDSVMKGLDADDMTRLELADDIESWLVKHKAKGGDLYSIGPTDAEFVAEALYYRTFFKPGAPPPVTPNPVRPGA